MERIFIGIGSNMGDRRRAIEDALTLLAERPEIELVGCASLYETEPVGVQDQPWFLNTVAELAGSLPPAALLEQLKAIERRLGRKTRSRWGPREIDLDLLLYGGRVVNEPQVVVPHPEMHKRRFVLIPLAELAPEQVHPVLNRTIRALLRELNIKQPDLEGVRLSQETIDLSKRFSSKRAPK